MKRNENVSWNELSDKEILDMLAKIFGVGVNPNSIHRES